MRLVPPINLDLDKACFDDRLVELRSLVPFGQIGIKIVFPGKLIDFVDFELVARPIFMANSTTCLFKTGRLPGMPRHTGQVWVLGGEPNEVEQPQKIFESVFSWA